MVPKYVGYVWVVMLLEFKVDDWDEYGLNGSYFASTLEIRNNFVIIATPDNEENVEFYILKCPKQPFTCLKAFTYKGQFRLWSRSALVGQEVLAKT